MNKRLISVFLFALIVSAVASLVLYQFISKQMASAAKTPGSTVVVATRDLEVGAMVKPDDVKIATWSGPVPEGAFDKIDDVSGRGVVYTIFRDEPVVKNRLAERESGAGLAATIPSGYRAVAVRVNEVVGISGFATPGMKVDVLVTGTPPGPNSSVMGTQNRTLLQNIEILSAGQNIQKDAEGKPVIVPVVNLKVTPEQAEMLSLASTDARIQLILRNPADKEIVKTPGTAMASLFGSAPPPAPTHPAAKPAPKVAKVAPPPPPPPPPPAPPVVEAKPPAPITVEVIHGSKRVEVKFPGEQNAAEPKTEQEHKSLPAAGKIKAEGDGL